MADVSAKHHSRHRCQRRAQTDDIVPADRKVIAVSCMPHQHCGHGDLRQDGCNRGTALLHGRNQQEVDCCIDYRPRNRCVKNFCSCPVAISTMCPRKYATENTSTSTLKIRSVPIDGRNASPNRNGTIYSAVMPIPTVHGSARRSIILKPRLSSSLHLSYSFCL